jgi:hypothetical protein
MIMYITADKSDILIATGVGVVTIDIIITVTDTAIVQDIEEFADEEKKQKGKEVILILSLYLRPKNDKVIL